MKIILICVITYLIIINLISFIAYGRDKKKAEKGVWRTPEKVLLLLGFFGGAIGAMLAMKLFHHKTKHWYFWAVNIISLIIHIVILFVVFY